MPSQKSGESSSSDLHSSMQLSKREESSDHLDSVFHMSSITLILKLHLVILISILHKLLQPTLHIHSKLCNIWFVKYNMVEELLMLLIEK